MKLKIRSILLSFSLVFTVATCQIEDGATQQEIYAVEEIPQEDDLDLDLDALDTADVNALLEEVSKIEEQPHDITWAQKYALVTAFFEMQAKNAWDEFKADPLFYSVVTASVIASLTIAIYLIKTSGTKKGTAKRS